jgi:hypothetical protein
MSDRALGEQRDASLALLHRLIRRGLELRGHRLTPQSSQSQAVSSDSANGALYVVDSEVRIWQNDCAAAINDLSGGSKAHWLSRAFSSALLVRGTDGSALVEANLRDIVSRILEVLQQAAGSLATLDSDSIGAAGSQPRPRKFEFVHDATLRPVLEQAFAASHRALEVGNFEQAMKTTCGILEAIITDALERDARLLSSRVRPSGAPRRSSPEGRANGGKPRGEAPRSHDEHAARDGGAERSTAANERDTRPILEWTFDQRIAAAEQRGLVGLGCARLTPAARAYRDPPARVVSETDAKIAAQVLRVVMRDLDPGR